MRCATTGRDGVRWWRRSCGPPSVRRSWRTGSRPEGPPGCPRPRDSTPVSPGTSTSTTGRSPATSSRRRPDHRVQRLRGGLQRARRPRRWGDPGRVRQLRRDRLQPAQLPRLQRQQLAVQRRHPARAGDASPSARPSTRWRSTAATARPAPSPWSASTPPGSSVGLQSITGTSALQPLSVTATGQIASCRLSFTGTVAVFDDLTYNPAIPVELQSFGVE